MGDVYVIVSGEYSDWSIIGYCDNEEEAAKRCFQNNTQDDVRHWDEWYYLSVTKMEDSDLSNIHPDYYYTITALKYPGGWEFSTDINVELTDQAYTPGVSVDEVYGTKCKFDKSASIEFKSKELNREKALKIAQDMLYKKLAELDNL